MYSCCDAHHAMSQCLKQQASKAKGCPAANCLRVLLPIRVPSGSLGWNANCAPATIGGMCVAACAANTPVGTGYVATCSSSGTWSVTGSCAVCLLQPNNALVPDSVGWAANCAPAAVGGHCTAACKAGKTGLYTGTCTSSGSWSGSGGCPGVCACSCLPVYLACSFTDHMFAKSREQAVPSYEGQFSSHFC